MWVETKQNQGILFAEQQHQYELLRARFPKTKFSKLWDMALQICAQNEVGQRSRKPRIQYEKLT